MTIQKTLPTTSICRHGVAASTINRTSARDDNGLGNQLGLWEPHARCRLVESFCGGLAVALGLLPKRALLNDANPHMINS